MLGQGLVDGSRDGKVAELAEENGEIAEVDRLRLRVIVR